MKNISSLYNRFLSIFQKNKNNVFPAPDNIDYEHALLFFKKQHEQYKQTIDYLCQKLNSKDTIVDVGANIGYFTLRLLEKMDFSGKAHLFEPIPNLANLCKETFKDKPWNVQIHPYALGDKNGNAVIYVAQDGNIGWNTLEAEKTSRDMKPLEISIKRFDSLGITDLQLIKIDVEGSEYKVLNGMMAALKILDPLPIIAVEVGWGRNSHPHWDREYAVFKELLDLGYQSVGVDDQKIDLNDITSTQDVFFLPPS